MWRLPPELWLKICAYLDLPDAARLRLGCRTLSAIGAPFVLREVSVSSNSDAFDLLRAVASDPIKAASIRSLVYGPGRFYPLEHPDIKVTNYVPQSSGLISEATLQALDKYKKACRNQALILSHDLDYELFADVLPRLTGLRSFIINCEAGRPEHTTTHKGSSSSSNRPNSWASWRPPTRHPHPHHGKPGRRALASLLRAIAVDDNSSSSSGTVTFPSLKALGLSWESLEDLGWATTRRPQLTPFFTGIRNLSLQFCLCGVFRRDDAPRPWGGPGPGDLHQTPPREDLRRYARLLGSEGALPAFLAAMPSLTSLAISFCYGLGPTNISLVAGDDDGKGKQQRWPCLESISLGGLNLPRSMLMDFLGSHKATLRRIELFSVGSDGDWPEMLREMRGMLALEDAAVWTRIYNDAGQWHLGRPMASGAAKGEAWRGEHVNLATAVARYLVNGGECPVTERNMIPGTTSLVRGCYTCSLY
ncbi:hypothetical protein N657DRAFT_577432 [Parathielavia appendiculata]|uniref:F-box domain-containing protein n=1 Tax=Parathielavia appendiculata TaxID=2587402 RepID=A0AAN6TVK5_9PEZI|nr:hypothetical protein N657DRAFT_577432 [Parathielavia appendiculata]